MRDDSDIEHNSNKPGAGDLEEKNERLKYLLFRVGEDMYGIELKQVREVLELPEITSVPEVPEWVSGIINIRGSVTTVFDFKKRFSLTSTEKCQRPCVVIVDFDKKKIGFTVDEIIMVEGFDREEIQEAKDFEDQGDDYIHGVIKPKEGHGNLKSHLILIVNIAPIFDQLKLIKSTGDVHNKSHPEAA